MDDQPGTPSLASPPSPRQPRPSPTSVVKSGVNVTFWWSIRFLVIGVALGAVLWLLSKGWSLLLPLLLGILLSAILWPLTQVLRSVMPRAVAAIVSLVLLLAAVVGIFAALIPNVAGQTQQISASAIAGLNTLQDYVSGPPLNLGDGELTDLFDQVVGELQANAQNIASGVISGASSVGSGVITTLLVLVLSFFVLADGDRMLPWSRRWLDANAHRHAVALGGRIWTAIRGYIVSQAAVALVDAVFIGIGLAIVGVPLALPLAVLIFFAAFIPIVGAVASGAIAVLIALVTLGWPQALIVLGIVLLVQQIEGNVLQPFLVGKSLALHPAVVIGSVTIGGTVFGITGAFLAVPVTAILTVILRYIHHELVPDQPETPMAEQKPSRRRRRVTAPDDTGQPAPVADRPDAPPTDPPASRPTD